MTHDGWKAELRRLKGSATRARTKLKACKLSLADKLVLKREVLNADEAVRLHKLYYHDLVQ